MDSNLLNIDKIYQPKNNNPLELPIFLESVSAGFLAPAEDYIEKKLDLNSYLIPNRESTFFVRALGNSMLESGIHSGDILIVDRSRNPQSGNIIIALVEENLSIRRLESSYLNTQLTTEDPKDTPIIISSDMKFECWGVVTNVIHNLI